MSRASKLAGSNADHKGPSQRHEGNLEDVCKKASLADLLLLQKLTLIVDGSAKADRSVLLDAMAEILDIDPSAEDSNEQLVQKQSPNNDPTLTRAGTNAVLLNSLNFLDDGLRSFRRNADLSEVQFLADLLFSHEQETTANKKKGRDNRRCLIDRGCAGTRDEAKQAIR